MIDVCLYTVTTDRCEKWTAQECSVLHVTRWWMDFELAWSDISCGKFVRVEQFIVFSFFWHSKGRYSSFFFAFFVMQCFLWKPFYRRRDCVIIPMFLCKSVNLCINTLKMQFINTMSWIYLLYNKHLFWYEVKNVWLKLNEGNTRGWNS